MINILLIIVGLGGAAFFHGSETTFISRIYKPTKGIAEWWRNRPGMLLSTVLVGTNLSLVVATAIATNVVKRNFGLYSEAITTIAISIIVLIFCETIPKSLALKKDVKGMLALGYTLVIFRILAFPVIWCATEFTKGITKIFEIIGRTDTSPQPKELMELLRKPAKGLDEGRLVMLLVFLRFANKRILDVMTPISQVGSLDVTKKANLAHSLIKEGRPYIIIYDVDRPLGVIDSSTAALMNPNEPIDINRISTEFIPESKDASAFLRETVNDFTPAVVIDEFGNVTGAFGGSPLLKKILRTKELPEKVLEYAGASIVIKGNMTIDQLNIITGEQLPRGPYRTVSGFIQEHLKQIPKSGYTFKWEFLKFVILSADERRIYRVRVERCENSE